MVSLAQCLTHQCGKIVVSYCLLHDLKEGDNCTHAIRDEQSNMHHARICAA